MASMLTAREEAFARAYISTGNATDAYRQTHPNSRATEKSQNEIASHLIASVKMQSRIAELRASEAQIAVVSAARIDRELAKLAFEVECSAFGLTYGNKLKALELLCRRLGLLTDRHIVDLSALEREIDQRLEANGGTWSSQDERRLAVEAAAELLRGKAT